MYNNVEQLNQFADKVKIDGVTGTVNKVYLPGNKGPINAKLAMIGGEYTIAFWPSDWDQDSVLALEGKSVELSENLSKSVRKSGGKTYHSVNVHKGASIAFLDGGVGVDTTQPVKTPSANPQASQNQPKPLQAKLEIQKMSNLHCACFVAATHQRENLAHAGHKMTEEMFQATVSSLFIQASRENLHKLMPDSPISLKPVEKAEPKQESETTFYDE